MVSGVFKAFRSRRSFLMARAHQLPNAELERRESLPNCIFLKQLHRQYVRLTSFWRPYYEATNERTSRNLASTAELDNSTHYLCWHAAKQHNSNCKWCASCWNVCFLLSGVSFCPRVACHRTSIVLCEYWSLCLLVHFVDANQCTISNFDSVGPHMSSVEQCGTSGCTYFMEVRRFSVSMKPLPNVLSDWGQCIMWVLERCPTPSFCFDSG